MDGLSGRKCRLTISINSGVELVIKINQNFGPKYRKPLHLLLNPMGSMDGKTLCSYIWRIPRKPSIDFFLVLLTAHKMSINTIAVVPRDFFFSLRQSTVNTIPKTLVVSYRLWIQIMAEARIPGCLTQLFFTEVPQSDDHSGSHLQLHRQEMNVKMKYLPIARSSFKRTVDMIWVDKLEIYFFSSEEGLEPKFTQFMPRKIKSSFCMFCTIQGQIQIQLMTLYEVEF